MTTSDSLLLLQQMLNGGAGDREAVAQALEAHEDPRVRIIAQYMAQQSAVVDETDGAQDVEPVPVELPSSPRRSQSAQRARRRVRELIEELEVARTIGDTLAAALGACYLCWGEDRLCENCQGEGGAGWAVPDRELFARYVLPAVRRFEPGPDGRQPSRGSPDTEPHDRRP